MTLDEYFDTVSPGKRDEIEGVWQWAAEVLAEADLDYVREAVENECRLSVSAWDDLLSALNEAGDGHVHEVMTQVFRSWTLCGPKISEQAPTPKGRALSVSRFRSLMRKAGMSPRRQDQIIEDVRNDFTPEIPYSEQLSHCELGKHLIWSTFSKDKEDGTDPFQNWTSADTVRDRLGLQDPQHPDNPEERGLVLLVYRVPSSVTVRYPTIAEAYASSGWNPNFQCSDPEDPWGYTSGDRPEVVHDVIQGRQFIQDRSDSVYAFAPLRIVD